MSDQPFDDRDPATRTPAAWARAALELEAWVNDSYMDPYVTAAMRQRARELWTLAGVPVPDRLRRQW